MPQQIHRTTVMWISRPELNKGRVGYGEWRPTCSCGWVGRDQPVHRDAEHDADGHVLAMCTANQ